MAGIATAAASISLTVFAIIGSLGVERAAKLTYPIYSLVQEVAVNDVFINIQSVISIILLTLIFIKLQVLYYVPAREALAPPAWRFDGHGAQREGVSWTPQSAWCAPS